MIDFNVIITQEIQVSIDESKMTEEFMEEFRNYMYNFNDYEDHASHIGECYARGIISDSNKFLEGYGNLNEMGIIIEPLDIDTEIEDSE